MKIERKYIYDLFLRILHGVIAFSTLLLFLSAKLAEINEAEGYLRKTFWVVHIFAGYGLGSAFLLRMAWGFIGPSHARFNGFLHGREWKKLIRSKNLQEIVWDWGHHPLASISYIIFYFSVFVLSVSGIILSAIEHDRGPLAKLFYDELAYKHTLKEIHEAFTWIAIVFVLSHLFALFYHEHEDGVPVIQSMFSGFQYKKKEREDSHEEK